MSNGICTGAQITPKNLAQFNGKPLNTNEGTNYEKGTRVYNGRRTDTCESSN